jgi:hypothetical protein
MMEMTNQTNSGNDAANSASPSRTKKMVLRVSAIRTVPRRWRLDRFRASLVAHGAAVAFAFDRSFRACLLAGSENLRHHRLNHLLARASSMAIGASILHRSASQYSIRMG